jgi:hypothetical protein
MMSTPQEHFQCVLWLAELQYLQLSSIISEDNMDVNLLHGKAFGSETKN